MKNLIKLVSLILILVAKNSYTFESSSITPSKELTQVNQSLVDSEIKKETEDLALLKLNESIKASEDRLAKINAYRSKCLEEYMPKVLSNIVQEYEPIEDKWEYKIGFKHHDNPILSLCALSSNKLISGSISGHTNAKLKIFDLNTLQIKEITNKICGSLCLLQDNRLVAGFEGGEIGIFSLEDSKDLGIGKYEKSFIENKASNYFKICSLPKNKLAIVCRNKTITIWDLGTYKCEKTLKGHTGYILSLCLLPNNKLASGAMDGSIKIWNLETGECEKTLGIPLDTDRSTIFEVGSLCLLPGNKLASGLANGTINIWNLETDLCETILHNKGEITKLCLLPGNELASGHLNGAIKIWDLTTGKCKQVLKSHSSSVNEICLLQNNEFASVSADGTIRISSNPVFSLQVPN